MFVMHKSQGFFSIKHMILYLLGEVISTTQAFVLLKSCGPNLFNETDESRNELATHVWNELERTGKLFLFCFNLKIKGFCLLQKLLTPVT